MQRVYYGGPSQYSFGPGAITPVVKALIWANVVTFLLTALIPSAVLRWFLTSFGLTPQLTLELLKVWQPFTYLFLHGGIGHILINMLFLWMFGVQLERLWGSRFFLRYYLVSGVGAGLVTIVVSLLPFAFSASTYATVTIGASGAIYGLLTAFALYYPNTPILMFFLIPVPAKYFVMICGAVAFVSAPRGGGVSHVTHLGGLLVGYLYLKRVRGVSARRFGFGRLGIMADIKYRYLKWKIGRLRKRFDVYSGRGGRGGGQWNDRVH